MGFMAEVGRGLVGALAAIGMEASRRGGPTQIRAAHSPPRLRGTPPNRAAGATAAGPPCPPWLDHRDGAGRMRTEYGLGPHGGRVGRRGLPTDRDGAWSP